MGDPEIVPADFTKVAISAKFTVFSSKSRSHHRIFQILQKRSSMANRMANLWSFCFHHNFSKKIRLYSKVGCMDASRRQLQSGTKILKGLKYFFHKKYDDFSFPKKTVELLPHATTPVCVSKC